MHRSSIHLEVPAAAAAALAPLAPLLLRAAIGCGLLMHGYAKLARGPETFAVVLHTLGVPWPGLLAWLTTFVELTGALLCWRERSSRSSPFRSPSCC